jgi:hypothetical protein
MHALVGVTQKIGRTNSERRSQNLEARSQEGNFDSAFSLLTSAFKKNQPSALCLMTDR